MNFKGGYALGVYLLFKASPVLAEVQKKALPVVNLNFTMILQWVNFAILLFLLYKLLYNPLIKALDERHNSIKKSLEEAEKARKEAVELREKWQKELEAFKQERDRMFKEARKEAEEMKEEIVKAAYEQAKSMTDEVYAMMNKMKDEMVKTVRLEAVKIAFDVARQILAREVNAKLHEDIVKKFIKRMEKKG